MEAAILMVLLGKFVKTSFWQVANRKIMKKISIFLPFQLTVLRCK